jgi:serine protease Do
LVSAQRAAGEMTPGQGESYAVRPELESDLTAVTLQLRRVTVQIRGAGVGAGCGVIWSADGLIVTNAHVAQGGAQIRLPDGRRVVGHLLARDPDHDLAALVIEVDGLTPARVRDSQTLRVGELVVAVGNPLGMAGALTAGIIHAIAPRRSVGPRFIQADLKLAPGNSGGPLADARGQVVGINAMVAGDLALAVPSNAVTRFLSSVPGRGTPP